jgi:hypothetical protein
MQGAPDPLKKSKPSRTDERHDNYGSYGRNTERLKLALPPTQEKGVTRRLVRIHGAVLLKVSRAPRLPWLVALIRAARKSHVPRIHTSHGNILPPCTTMHRHFPQKARY